MERDNVCDETSQRSPGVNFPHDEHKRFLRDELFSKQFSQIWTKRQNPPEWKPRRASVATCQQQQQQLMAQHYGYKTAYQFNLTSANIKELIVQRRLQHYQQQQQQQQQQRDDITIDRCALDEVVSKLEDLDIRSDKSCENVLKEAARVTAEREMKRAQVASIPSCKSGKEIEMARARLGSATSVSTDATTTTTTTSNSESDSGKLAALDGVDCASPSHDLPSSIGGELGRAVSKPDELSNQKQSNSATCCADPEAEREIPTSRQGCPTARRIQDPESMSEKLQLQDKQRKHVILSMALKQMLAEQHSLSGGGGGSSSTSEKKPADYYPCSCRSRSCSVSSARILTPRSAMAAAATGTSALTASRSVVFDDACCKPVRPPSDTHNSTYTSHGGETSRQSICVAALQSASRDEDSFAETVPQPKRRYSGAFEAHPRTQQEDRNIFRPQSSAAGQQQQPRQSGQQARNSIDEDLASRLNSMRQLVTSKNSPECEAYSQDGCHDECEAELRSGSMLDHQCWSNKSTARVRSETSRRSCSALAKSSQRGPSAHHQSNQNEINLEALIVESWLDDHPNFTHDYIMRKATRQVVDDWLVANAKVSNTALSSQLDLRSVHTMSRPVSQISLGGYLRAEPSWRCSELLASDIDEHEAQGQAMGSLRANRSNSQSASITANRAHGFATPIRKISATDFETRTGSGFLRPMLSKTPDGRLTFLPQSNALGTRELLPSTDSVHEISLMSRVSKKPDSHRSSVCDQPQPQTTRSSGSSITIEVGARLSDSPSDRGGGRELEVAEANGGGELEDDGEVKLIFELVKNIYDDLDIRTLLHKILKNIAVLINADRSSLFLVCGGPGDPNRRLVSQLFNVDQDSSEVGEPPDESITIPWGTGLVGFVAASGEAVNITNCYEDPRFTDAIDQRTGYVTKHMLCAPILDKHNEIVGVAQVINKRDGNAFSKNDELKFMRYLQFCGIGLRNAQSYEQCQLENRRNQVLLDLARMVFEEQSTIEQVVYRIMLHTQSLLDCERCQVLLIDDGNDELENLHQFSSYRCSTLHSTDTSAAQRRVDKCLQYQSLLMDKRNSTIQDDQVDFDNIQCSANANGNKTSAGCAMEQQCQATGPKLFSLVFDLECDGNDPVIHSSKEAADTKTSRAFPVNIGITGYVALTGETLNIENAHEHERFDVSVDEGSDFRHKSILCMPIRNGQRQIIGVIQLINKKNGQPFNKNDEDLFEAFAIFCGLGIHNTLMYERVLKVMAKQRVTFEVLSYHATAPLEEAKKLSLEQIPSCFALNLASLKFNDFSLDEQYMLKSCLRFFLDLDLIRRFQIDQLVFCNWILSVQKNYRKVTYHPIVGGDGLKASPVRYHNWRHAFNVSQMMFAILVNTQICQALGELETLALLIACLCHDLDHRGTNNSFQIKSASPLAELYSTSTMEHHHFDQCVMILNSQGNQILSNLSPEEYSRVIMLLEEAILATDLANYFRNRDHFFQLINSNTFDWQADASHRSLLRCMLMTACDVAAITKPWPVQKVVADLVMSEFYQQGDIERSELNIEPIDMMNRDKMSELPSMQIGFIDSICAPIYTAFAKLFPHELTTLLDGCLSNRNLWQEVADSSKPSDAPLISYLARDSEDLEGVELPLSGIASENDSNTSESNLSSQLRETDSTTLKRKSAPETNDRVIKLPFEDNRNESSTSNLCDGSVCATRTASQRRSI